MNRNRKVIAITATAIAGAVILHTGGKVFAETSKKETVYAIADASGSVREVIVSEWLKNVKNAADLEDYSILEDIENTSGEETFFQDGQEIVWNTDGNDIYYRGSTSKELPVSVRITYYLDGKEIRPEALTGKSGKVVIRYDYTNHQTKTVKIKGKEETISVPFTVMSGMMFTDGCAKNVEVNSGKVITEDDRTIVVGMAFPGLKDSLKKEDDNSEIEIDPDIPDYVEVTMDAEDFQMDMAASVVFSDAFEKLDLDDNENLDELRDSLDELSDGAKELVDGSNELADGVGELYDQVPERPV